MKLKLKVMTYNLLYASHERQGDTMLFHEERAGAAREVVLGEAPDILGLTEAVYCGLGGCMIRPDYARLFGLEHLFSAGFDGEWGSCLLSRYPILHAERLPLGRGDGRTDGASQMSAVRAVLGCDGCEVHVDVVHPSPKIFEADRVEAFLPLLRSARRPGLMIGDFNALSDEDPYDRATLVRQLTGQTAEPEVLATRMLDRQLISVLRAHGLVDTLSPASRTHTLPTRLSRPHALQGAALRLDYIFASSEFTVERSAVIKSAAADRASDHYPVVAELGL
ncbi:MAG: endonuclease/exonuclease/phosphatase family protein [Acidobacteria bacterium]|nr:endonuclease/exonuclease/phosphatase family protein [Acidobacteriota bacterium]MCA1652473.1 endonuclease/exonuclease/phosphatase family protein [Acidobacteriota bacterium]